MDEVLRQCGYVLRESHWVANTGIANHRLNRLEIPEYGRHLEGIILSSVYAVVCWGLTSSLLCYV